MRAAHGDVVVVVVMHGQDDGDGGSNGWEREKLCRMEVMVVNASVIKLCRMEVMVVNASVIKLCRMEVMVVNASVIKLCRMEVMVVNASVIKLCRMVGLMMAKGHVKILVGVVMGTNSCDEMVQDEGGDDGEWL